MQLTKLSDSSWRLSDADVSVANLIRHALMADVPVQAVDQVTFHQYNGPLESAMIAHRMGQLPVRGLEPLQFTLKKEAPLDAPLTWATSLDITEDDGRVVKGVQEGIASGFLLVPLLAGQKVHLTCRTSLGTGRQRSTWNSVFPVVEHNEADLRTFDIHIETTGAIQPEAALHAAMTYAKDVFTALSV